MSNFKRPEAGISDDPEESYRSGFQDGATAALKAMQATSEIHQIGKKVERWIAIDLQNWRHNSEADPKPPIYRNI